ncbi:glutathione S-transferase family protein [Vibrio superstes]|uniref:Glutathione S-transferase n=1 Tax=Vibrio superstes NBRC 103154 TaxID=1219062 RepID=A0A511QRH3_9VIBR|nr:glutathione S-transferase family protein [Vibrio superstes]GEM79955.1 glutathione S-transferase [Vibrio superstes NBRC 103154]
MLKIVSFKICPFVQRVTGALAAKGIPFEIEYISLKEKTQWFLDLSPNGQVPVLITESDTALFESDAIVEYIEDEYGPLEENVSNEQRALDRAWSYLGTKHYLPQCGAMSSKSADILEQRSEKLIAAFNKVEKKLDPNFAFFKSNDISNIDIAWLPLLHRAHIIKQHSGYDFLCGLPKAQTWQKSILSSGLVEQTVSGDFEIAFKSFYLKNTYLAESKNIAEPKGCRTNASCC